MVVSCAFSPPSITASPPSRVVAPAPLVARGRSGSRTQDEFSKLKQSTRVVAGERPPATHTSGPKTNPDTWLRGAGREGTPAQACATGPYPRAGAEGGREELGGGRGRRGGGGFNNGGGTGRGWGGRRHRGM